MRTYRPLVDLQGRLQRKEQGCLIAGNLALYYRKGTLVHVTSKGDVLWMLRRLLVHQYISNDEANALLHVPELHKRFFPRFL